MMNDLDILRPEVREAINRTDMTVEMFDTLVTVNRDDYDIIRAELLRLAEYEQAAGRLAIEKAEFRQRAEQYEAELASIPDADEWHALRERAERAEAELAALKARTQWQPIATAPKNETFILVLDVDGDVRYARWDKPGWWCGYDCYGNDAFVEDPARWMPLPPPPSVED